MSKWTAGEWRVESQPERNMILIGTDDYIVCEINEVVDQDCDNAHLISAAPVLAESTEWLLDAIHSLLSSKPVRDMDERISFAEKSLRKARG